VEGSTGCGYLTWVFTERPILVCRSGLLCSLSRNTTTLEHTFPQFTRLLGRRHIGANTWIAQNRLLRTKSCGLTRKPTMRSGTLARTSLAFRYPPCRFSPLGQSSKLIRGRSHPPTCPYPECQGKSFSQQKGLKVHLKIHEGREVDGRLDGVRMWPMTTNRLLRREGVGNTEETGLVTLKGARRTSNRYFLPLNSVSAFSQSRALNRKRRLPRITTSRTSTNGILSALKKIVASPMVTNISFSDMLHGHIDQQSRLIAPVIQRTIMQRGSGWISTELQEDPIWRETPRSGGPCSVPIPTFP
jgi:hypothetical protein